MPKNFKVSGGVVGCLPCLKELVAAAQILLVVWAEADTIGDAAALEDPDIYGPQPQHRQHDQQRLVVDVEQLQVIEAGRSQAGHDGIRRESGPS